MENLMSLNPYVRQLRPRNESYIPPVDKVQGLFEFSVLFETDREEKNLDIDSLISSLNAVTKTQILESGAV